MLTLGIEGTSHTIGAGIVRDGKILSSVSKTFVPEKGGIHPREAANHHFIYIKEVVDKAINNASVNLGEIDLVAFSKGPGLGPCLRVAATAARSISVRYHKPIVGVNHAMGHLEIARLASGFRDPAFLYVSGGNTQVIMHSQGIYRVFGETMDIGLGNLLDKLARGMGYPFPGGPALEKLAMKGKELLDLPYSVKGMDTAYSGILTAAEKLLSDGKSMEDVAYSVQETCFSMVLECLERGLKHLSKEEIILTGGVAANRRFREMFQKLGDELGVGHYAAEPEYCGDNGAMIAIAGALVYESTGSHNLKDTGINQRFRIDEITAPWIVDQWRPGNKETGAEAVLSGLSYNGRNALNKTRVPKSYRNADLDLRLRRSRMAQEFQVLHRLESSGISVPIIYGYKSDEFSIVMEKIEGTLLREMLHEEFPEQMLQDLISVVYIMHKSNLSHGDLTTSNIIVGSNGTYTLIDPSMGSVDASDEDKAADLFLLEESFRNNGIERPERIEEIYYKLDRGNIKVIEKLELLKSRRRYV